MIGAFLTERLALRPVDSDDLELLVDLNGDIQVMEFITGRASSTDETAAELEASVGTRWLTFARPDGQFLGWVGAVPAPQGDEYDVGWRLKRSAWGHGYATEAAGALIAQLFADGAQRVFAQTMAVNTRAQRPLGPTDLGRDRCRTLRATRHSPRRAS